MSKKQIYYSDKYNDKEFEYRYENVLSIFLISIGLQRQIQTLKYKQCSLTTLSGQHVISGNTGKPKIGVTLSISVK